MKIRLHNSLFSALEHPSTWAGFAGVMTSLGTETDKPVSAIFYGISACCSITAILIKPPANERKNP